MGLFSAGMATGIVITLASFRLHRYIRNKLDNRPEIVRL